MQYEAPPSGFQAKKGPFYPLRRAHVSECSTLDDVRPCEESFLLPAAEEKLPNLFFEQSLYTILWARERSVQEIVNRQDIYKNSKHQKYFISYSSNYVLYNLRPNSTDSCLPSAWPSPRWASTLSNLLTFSPLLCLSRYYATPPPFLFLAPLSMSMYLFNRPSYWPSTFFFRTLTLHSCTMSGS